MVQNAIVVYVLQSVQQLHRSLEMIASVAADFSTPTSYLDLSSGCLSSHFWWVQYD